MKIKRNGIEIELTADEMNEAYREIYHYYQIEDLRCRICEYAENADDAEQVYIGNTCMTADEWKNLDRETLDKLADKFDRAISNHDLYMDCYWNTIDSVLEDYFTVEEE